MIQFHNVSKRYPSGHQALHEVSFHIPRGEMAFLTGHSGAGKSTLLRLVTLIERATQGQVIINDHNLNRLSPGRIPYFRREIGVIFQDYKLLHDRTVFDNVALPLVIAGFPHREVGRRVRAALDKVGLLDKEHQSPVTLSGGEQQRVSIARAVVNRPALLVADEPTGNLDPELALDIMNLFREFNRLGTTLLIASHDWDLISRQHCRVLALKGGALAHDQGVVFA